MTKDSNSYVVEPTIFIEPAFKKGDIVVVYNQHLSGEPYIEGWAKIIRMAPSGYENHYTVQWMHPPVGKQHDMVTDRFVYPGEAQSNSDAHLALAITTWRANRKWGGMVVNPDIEPKP